MIFRLQYDYFLDGFDVFGLQGGHGIRRLILASLHPRSSDWDVVANAYPYTVHTSSSQESHLYCTQRLGH